jgi:DNA-binding transcriptional regulator YiaG
LWFDVPMGSATENLDGLVAELLDTRLPPPAVRRRIRKRAGISARRLAKALGVATTTLLHWEDGANPRAEHAAKYRAALERLQALAEAA